ncbi:hypothetical protein AAIR98_000566 [Elusimicrobium simillimum]|uniref:hypothetical protein n=1 Tax=Elusimicrobium simillimum TaxID=3143438 RepID=UPI003C701A10
MKKLTALILALLIAPAILTAKDNKKYTPITLNQQVNLDITKKTQYFVLTLDSAVKVFGKTSSYAIESEDWKGKINLCYKIDGNKVYIKTKLKAKNIDIAFIGFSLKNNDIFLHPAIGKKGEEITPGTLLIGGKI